MDKQDVFDFIKANPRSFLATIDGGVPRVRGMGIPRADEKGIVIQTVTMKDVYKQLSDNPSVELCFNDYENHAQIRVSGKAVKHGHAAKWTMKTNLEPKETADL
ncbi:MAG: pyridoxamine 5'-phosphate oxidase family protein [Dehalococcoidia bacterium]